MPDPAAIAALVDAGGWTLFVATVITIAIAVQRKWLVPGWIYQHELVKNADLLRALGILSRAFARLAGKKRASPDG
jgi:hypothetical protein